MGFKKIKLPFKVAHSVLALGANTKNTICFANQRFAYISSVHLDLNCPQDFLIFEKEARYFLKKNPKIIAYDLHPEYQSSKFVLWLQAPSSKLQAIQHHHAHIASCMAENGLKNQKVIGVAFDGTGLGSDGKIWGAEFLICDYRNFRRVAHLKEIPLVGGEKAILEPYRLTEAWLNFKFTKKGRLLKRIYDSGINSPLASSMGRLFDAVGSLLLGRREVKFEAELALELERVGTRAKKNKVRRSGGQEVRSYTFKILKCKEGYILDPSCIFKEIISDLKTKKTKTKIAYRFHLTVAEMIGKACLIFRKETGVNKVVLSGGVFQNNLLLKLAADLLYKEGFKIFTHQKLPSNDSSISLGQAIIAGVRF